MGESVFWLIMTGLAFLMSAVTDAPKQDRYFQRRAIDALKFAAFFEFFINIKSLTLIGELIVQAALGFLVAMRVVAGHKEHTNAATLRKVLDTIVFLLVAGLVLNTITFLVGNWSQVDKVQELRKLFIPIWLVLGAMPVVFVVTLVAAYGKLFGVMKAATGQDHPSWRARLGLTLGLRLRLLDIHALGSKYLRRAAISRTLKGGVVAVREFRKDRKKKATEQQAHLDNLARFAGAEGVDELGSQLDRREFAETKRTLQWLASCQTGWHSNQGGRYRADLLTRLGDFTPQGLLGDHGITMNVREDGQAWYAYRRTITGWVFGIGARNAPPDEWFYDGPEPPTSFPQPGDAGWGTGPHVETINWVSR